MSGYVGERARKKKNKIFFFILFLIFSFLTYFFYFSFGLKETKHQDNLLPSDEDISFLQAGNSIEDLENKIFDQKQKINFRNQQIVKLKYEINTVTFKNKELLKSVLDLNNKIESFLNIENEDIKANYQNKKDLKNLNKIIEKITKQNESLSKTNDILMQARVKGEKEFDNLNIKYENLMLEDIEINQLQIKIKNLENLVDEQNLIIQLLKDKTPHS